jgi:transcriptional regulator with XRE-family HTH domain
MKKDVLNRLGSRIRELRIRADLTQEQLAERAELHPTYLGGIERGERNLSLRNLDKVAAALQVPLKSLVEFGDEECHRTSQRLKDLIVGSNPRMEMFFAAFCCNCRYLSSFLILKDNRCHLTFFSIACKNCNPLRKFKQFIHLSPKGKL